MPIHSVARLRRGLDAGRPATLSAALQDWGTGLLRKVRRWSPRQDLLAAEAKAVEEADAASDPNAALPAHVKVTRGHPRARNLQVRFRDDEFDEPTAYAEQRGLPVSTVVRSLVLQAIAPADDLKSALDKLESDLAAVRRRALCG